MFYNDKSERLSNVMLSPSHDLVIFFSIKGMKKKKEKKKRS